MSNDKSLDKLFNVEHDEPKQDLVKVEVEVEVEVSNVQTDLDQDFEEARNNLRELTAMGQSALEEIALIAKQSEQPRSYDALSKLMSAQVIANKALLEIHKNRIEGNPDNEEDTTEKNITHNTLVVTTAEFQKQLQDLIDKNTNGS